MFAIQFGRMQKQPSGMLVFQILEIHAGHRFSKNDDGLEV